MTNGTDQSAPRNGADPMRAVSADIRQAQDAATRTVHDLRDQAGAAVEQVKAGTSEIAANASERVLGIVEQQKGAGADALGAMARAAHEAAGQIEEQTPGVARAVHQAAAGAERISRDLRERSVGELVNTVSDFARREPVAFFAGTVLAGLVLARFVKSSAPSHQNGATMAQDDGVAATSMSGSRPGTPHHDRMDPIARGVA